MWITCQILNSGHNFSVTSFAILLNTRNTFPFCSNSFYIVSTSVTQGRRGLVIIPYIQNKAVFLTAVHSKEPRLCGLLISSSFWSFLLCSVHLLLASSSSYSVPFMASFTFNSLRIQRSQNITTISFYLSEFSKMNLWPTATAQCLSTISFKDHSQMLQCMQ